MQPAARPAGQAVQGRRARRRRLPDRVHDHRRVRRHLDGPRGHARLAREPRDHRRLGRDGDARRALRRHGHLRRLRQEPARHAHGRGPLNLPSVFLYGGSILPGQHNGQALDIVDVFEAVGAHAAGTHRRRRARRHRAQRLPDRGQLRRHVHRQHDGVGGRGDRHVAARARRRRPPSTAAATTSPTRPARPSSACSSWASGRGRS